MESFWKVDVCVEWPEVGVEIRTSRKALDQVGKIRTHSRLIVTIAVRAVVSSKALGSSGKRGFDIEATDRALDGAGEDLLDIGSFVVVAVEEVEAELR